VVLQFLWTEDDILFFALFDDLIEHFVVELGGFLKHGQAEGGLDVPPVEEPVVQEVGRGCEPPYPIV